MRMTPNERKVIINNSYYDLAVKILKDHGISKFIVEPEEVTNTVKLSSIDSDHPGPNQFITFAAPMHLNLTKQDTPATNLLSNKFSRFNVSEHNFDFDNEIDITLDALGNWTEFIKHKNDNASGLDKQILNGEYDRAKKFTIIKGKRPYWHIPDVQARDPDLSSEFKIWTDRLIADYISVSQEYIYYTEFDPPVTTNAGYPCYMSGPLCKLISALLFMPNYEDLYKNCLEFSMYIGLPAIATLSYGVNARVSANSKPIPLYLRDSTNFVQFGKIEHGGPAVRQVWMAPYVLNMLLAPLVKACKAGRMGLHKLGIYAWHDASSLKMGHYLIQQAAYVEEIDQSQYDKHVGQKMQKVLRDSLKKYLPHLTQSIDAWYEAEQLPFMTKDIFGRNLFGSIITRKGQTSSGLAMTSDVGTLLNAIITTFTLGKLWNMTYDQIMYELKTHGTTLLILGDDLLIGTNKHINEEEFKKIQYDIGFDVKIEKGVRFLSKQYVPSGIRPIAANILQQSFSHERPPTGNINDITPIKILGFQSRWGIGPYDALVPSVSSVINTIPFFRDCKVNDKLSADKWLMEHADDLSRSLRARANASYIMHVINEAPYSPTAYTLFETLTKFEDVRPLFDMDIRVKKIIKAFTSLPSDKRFNLALNLYSYITKGREDTSILGQYEKVFSIAKLFGINYE
jgi:hypothetical protein